MIREISGRLYAVTKSGGRQQSQPLAAAEADAEQQRDAAAVEIQRHQAAASTATRQLRQALLEADDDDARAHQHDVDAALQSLTEAKARHQVAAERVAEFQQARIRHRSQQLQAEAAAALQALLEQHPIPVFTLPPEAA